MSVAARPELRLEKHVESDLALVDYPGAGPAVVKTYKPGQPCVAWLNQHLARYYDARAGMPVAQHEYAALELLHPHGIAPRPLRREAGAIVMAYAGTPITFGLALGEREFRAQAEFILATLARLSFRHNDLIPRNVLVDEGRLRIIDFTLSEFGPVRDVMARLPDPRWAYPERESDLPGYGRLYGARPGWLKRWAGRMVR